MGAQDNHAHAFVTHCFSGFAKTRGCKADLLAKNVDSQGSYNLKKCNHAKGEGRGPERPNEAHAFHVPQAGNFYDYKSPGESRIPVF